MTDQGARRRAIQAHLAGLGLPTEGAASGTGSPLPGSGGLSGMPMTPGGPEEAQRGAEGVERVTVSLAALRALEEKTRELDEFISDDRAMTAIEAAPYQTEIDQLVAALGIEPVDTPGPAKTADQEGPEAGHTFRLEAHSRMSSGLMEEGDPAPHDYRDADWFGEPPLTLEVRAWNLRDALLKAARIGLPEWRHEGRRLADGEGP